MKTGWPVVEIHSEGSMSQFFFFRSTLSFHDM